jgi:hypothetical protein
LGFTKKAISVGLSATMLATLLGTAFAGSAFATTPVESFQVTAASGTTYILPGGSTTITFKATNVLYGDSVPVTFTGGTMTVNGTAFTSGEQAPINWGTSCTSGTYCSGTGTATFTASATGGNATVAIADATVTPSVSASATVFVYATTTSSSATGTLYPWTYTTVNPPNNTTPVPANGLAYYAVTFGPDQLSTAGLVSSVQLSVTGGFFLNGVKGSNATTWNASFPSTSITLFNTGTTASTNPLLNGDVVWIASQTAGNAVFRVQYVSSTLGTNYDTQYSFAFTGATSTTLSTAYSTTTLSATSAPATAGSGVTASTVVADTNNSPVYSGATVTWTLSGPAVFATLPVSATYSANPMSTTCSTGLACAQATSVGILSTGVPGKVTVATTVSYLGVTYTLSNVTLSFYGTVAKIVASNVAYSIPATGALTTDGTGALDVALTDAAGNPITSGVTWGTPTYTPANIFTISAVPTGLDAAGTGYLFNVTCVADGTATVSVNATTPALSSTSVTSNTVTFTCADALSSTTVGSFTASAASTTVAPNGNTTITVKVLDDNKLPAPDGTSVTAVTNGVGNVVNTSGGAGGTTSNGVATFTYLAPANAGSGTVTIFVPNATPASQAITFTIGTPAPAVSATAGTVLGLGTSGSSYSAATKIAKYGQYVTWQFGFGSAAAGKNVTILWEAKSASGTWPGMKAFTGRIADANGNVTFHWKFSSAKWISVEAQLGTVTTPARQARWM